jgi:uncharacterized protein (TIGR00661 family)
MARILYGVMGDAGGHVNRARVVASEMPGHEFLFVGSGRVHDLKAYGSTVEDIPAMGTFYRNNRVDLPATVSNALKILLAGHKVTERMVSIIRSFDPHLIMTDYEYFTPIAAQRAGRFCVSLDNQHVLTLCTYPKPTEQRLSRLMTNTVVKWLYSKGDHFIITFFAGLQVRDPKRARVLPPLVRREILQYKPTVGEHVLVYQTSPRFSKAFPLFRAMKSPFYVYGFGKQPDQGNIVFKAPSGEGFLKDLASARYVICNGSHNVICEALCLGKPVFALPIGNAYEQFINAYFLAKLGYGDYSMDDAPSPASLESFEKQIEVYCDNVSKGDFFGNDQVVAALNEFLESGN